MAALFAAAVLLTAVIFTFDGCAGRQQEPIPEPVSDRSAGSLDLGAFHRTVRTDSAEAQAWFDRGHTLYWGFNHEAAIDAFREAARLDPDCAMAHWGIALAHGPHINNMEMDAAACAAAWEALSEARRLAGKASPVEQDLIRALSHRYADPAPDDRRALDEAYAEAMRGVWRLHPGDPDVGTLFAESLMDLRPWDLWSTEGEPRPETPQVMETLETVLALAPDHPGANHLYIHTCEASPEPGRALPAANRLRALIPDAGHLVHMPSHIDIRLGRYAEAVAANQRAVAADLRFVEEAGRGGFYTLYRAHNYHFLAYGAMFTGQRKVAMKAARNLTDEVPLDLVREMPEFLEGFLAAPIHVMIRFGLWEDLIAEPKPAADLPVTTAYWHLGRTVAFAALDRVEESAKAYDALREAYNRIPETSFIGNNPARVVLEVGLPFAEGELEYRRGNYDRAFELLGEAVRRDDALAYDEPWGWMEPVRHALGALLLEQGRVAEAEQVYRDDLRRHPENGWALHGLAECLRRAGRMAEAAEADARFRKAWANTDLEIKASCYCRTEV